MWAGTELELTNCSLTIEGDPADSANSSAAISIRDQDADKVDRDPAADPPAASVRIVNGLIRTAGDVIDVAAGRPLTLHLENSVVASSGSLAVGRGLPRGKDPEPLSLDIRRATLRVAGGLVRLESTLDEPELPIADVTAPTRSSPPPRKATPCFASTAKTMSTPSETACAGKVTEWRIIKSRPIDAINPRGSARLPRPTIGRSGMPPSAPAKTRRFTATLNSPTLGTRLDPLGPLPAATSNSPPIHPRPQPARTSHKSPRPPRKNLDRSPAESGGVISHRKGRPNRYSNSRCKIPKIVVADRGLGMNSCILNRLNLASHSARETKPFKPISHQARISLTTRPWTSVSRCSRPP